jgi:2-hydroxychromene-2-carboxylate isomerase
MVSGDATDRGGGGLTQLEFYFDYRSPYAYLAHTQLRLLKSEVLYRPFEIRGVMEMVGNVPTSVICKPKNRYIQADLRRWVSRYGVPFERHPAIMEIDSKRLLRATLWAAERGPVNELVTALFNAMWGGAPEPLLSAADVAGFMSRLGFDHATLDSEIDAPRWQQALDRATSEAADRGVFGAPCMFVGEEMFFGNDRLDFVRAELERAA